MRLVGLKSVSAKLEKSSSLILVTLASVLILAATLYFMAGALVGAVQSIPDDDGSRQRVFILDHIEPVARVAIANLRPAGAVQLSGTDIYNNVCSGCHATGTLGAPKTGSKEQWGPRFAQGMDTLLQHAVNGIRGMPAKGGDPSLTEANIKDAVLYMLKESDIKADVAPAKTAEAAKPDEAKKPAEAAKPKPTEAAKPDEAKKPAEAAKPKPAEAAKPDETKKPAEAAKPKPTEAAKPDETKKPAAEAAKTAEVTKPTEAITSTETGSK